jgi:predicted TPR repeat methyltransferase
VSHEISDELAQQMAVELPVLGMCEELIRSGKPAGAVAVLKKAIKTASGDWRLHSALGDALIAAGREEEAIVAFIVVTQLKPEMAIAYVKIGRAFFSRGMTDPALFWLRRAMEIDSNCDSGMYTLAMAEGQVGCRERVAELLEAWIASDPGNPILRHLATAILGEVTPLQAAGEYVVTLFDSYAPRFDESLASLQYCGPQLIAKALTQLGIEPSRNWNILDAGCGTGLVGAVLKPFARRLVGVDLSESMLQESAKRALYDELTREDMAACMLARPHTFNLVVAADALTYCGELAGFFSACSRCLVTGGYAIVNHESIEGAPPQVGYRLNRSGRFAHHADYVKKCLSESGFQIRWQTDQPMRHDQNRPVPTLLFAVEKSEGI